MAGYENRGSEYSGSQEHSETPSSPEQPAHRQGINKRLLIVLGVIGAAIVLVLVITAVVLTTGADSPEDEIPADDKEVVVTACG